MDKSNFLLLVVSSLGLINGVFLSIYLLFSKDSNNQVSRLLSILLLFTSLRIGKFVILYFNNEIHLLYHLLWFVSLSLFGVLSYFIIITLSNIKYEIRPLHLLHLLPVGLVMFFIGYDPFPKTEIIVFNVIKLQLLIYLIISTLTVFNENRKAGYFKQKDRLKFSIAIIASGFIAWFVYFLITFVKFNLFMVDALLYSILIYLFTFWILANKKAAEQLFKNKVVPTLDGINVNDIISNINLYMDSERPYLRANLSMPELASELKISQHLLSRLLNVIYNQNFNDFINNYRIGYAKKLIESPKYNNITISAIASECGFNSISVFNTAFKKITGKKPSQYRKSP